MLKHAYKVYQEMQTVWKLVDILFLTYGAIKTNVYIHTSIHAILIMFSYSLKKYNLD